MKFKFSIFKGMWTVFGNMLYKGLTAKTEKMWPQISDHVENRV